MHVIMTGHFCVRCTILDPNYCQFWRGTEIYRHRDLLCFTLVNILLVFVFPAPAARWYDFDERAPRNDLQTTASVRKQQNLVEIEKGQIGVLHAQILTCRAIGKATNRHYTTESVYLGRKSRPPP